ncbi:OLC1v1008963C1, partial [Oldenlandia corymbosa var. corymbosa]
QIPNSVYTLNWENQIIAPIIFYYLFTCPNLEFLMKSREIMPEMQRKGNGLGTMGKKEKIG